MDFACSSPKIKYNSSWLFVMRLIEAETFPADDRLLLVGWISFLMQSHGANFQEAGSARQGNPSFSHLDLAVRSLETDQRVRAVNALR